MAKVKFVSYTRQSIGKLVSSSKHKYIWRIKLDDKEHTIEFYKSKRGRRRVFVNGDKVLEMKLLAADGTSYPFSIKTGAKKVDITIIKVFDGEYDLRVGQLSYLNSLQEIEKSTEEIENNHIAIMIPPGSTLSYNYFESELDSNEETTDKCTKKTVQNHKKLKSSNSSAWASKENFSKLQNEVHHEASWGFSKNPFDDHMEESSNSFNYSSGCHTTKNSNRHHDFDFIRPTPIKAESAKAIDDLTMGSHHTRDHDIYSTHSSTRHLSLETNTRFSFPNKDSSPSKPKISSIKTGALIEAVNNNPASSNTSSQPRSSNMIDLVDFDAILTNSYSPAISKSGTCASPSISFPNSQSGCFSMQTDLNSPNPMNISGMMSPSHMNPMMTNPMMNPMGNQMMNQMMMNQYMTSMMMGQMMHNPYMPPR